MKKVRLSIVKNGAFASMIPHPELRVSLKCDLMEHMNRFRFLCAVLTPGVVLLTSGAAPAAAQSKGDQIAFIGTYTNGPSKGIHAFWLDSKTGKMTSIGLVGEETNPSFLAIHPNRKTLYAVSEVANFQGQKAGAVSAFRIDASTGGLTLLNRVESKGSGPCFVSVDRTGKNVLVANYGSGSVAVLPLDADGKLKESKSFVQHKGSSANPKRQEGPHAHSINLSPDNRFAVAADLGLDELLVYKFDANAGTITPNDPPFIKMAPGSGPRHFAFHPNGKYGYVINEILLTVTAMSWDARLGEFKELQTITTLPKDTPSSPKFSTAEVQVHPSGKFLYGSNRGHDTIAVFSIDPGKGTLTPVDHTPTQGRTPRNFGIDQTGNYLVAGNQGTNNLVVFKIDQKTGKLTPTGQTFEVGAPVCIRFMKVN
jgi:6-phosphogluconolactonase